jgi:hypothetical protein
VSGKVQPVTSPALVTTEHATKLLEEVVYERVLGFFDLDGLFNFEQELWLALGECGMSEDAIGDEAKAMIDRALARIADDPRRYATFGPPIGGEHAFGLDCPDCDDEARVRAQRRR